MAKPLGHDRRIESPRLRVSSAIALLAVAACRTQGGAVASSNLETPWPDEIAIDVHEDDGEFGDYEDDELARIEFWVSTATLDGPGVEQVWPRSEGWCLATAHLEPKVPCSVRLQLNDLRHAGQPLSSVVVPLESASVDVVCALRRFAGSGADPGWTGQVAWFRVTGSGYSLLRRDLLPDSALAGDAVEEPATWGSEEWSRFGLASDETGSVRTFSWNGAGTEAFPLLQLLRRIQARGQISLNLFGVEDGPLANVPLDEWPAPLLEMTVAGIFAATARSAPPARAVEVREDDGPSLWTSDTPQESDTSIDARNLADHLQLHSRVAVEKLSASEVGMSLSRSPYLVAHGPVDGPPLAPDSVGSNASVFELDDSTQILLLESHGHETEFAQVVIELRRVGAEWVIAGLGTCLSSHMKRLSDGTTQHSWCSSTSGTMWIHSPRRMWPRGAPPLRAYLEINLRFGLAEDWELLGWANLETLQVGSILQFVVRRYLRDAQVRERSGAAQRGR